RRCKRETLVGLRPPDVPRLQRKVDYFCAAQWPTFTPPLTIMQDFAPDGKQIRPDTSVGMLFSKWLRAEHPSVSDNYSMYVHVTEEWEGEVRQYPNSMLPLFIEFVDTVWIPEHSERYFNTRDPAALPYLPRLIANTNHKAISAA
ncbi:hypothetical protein JYP46_04685, partial [Nitratireductor aquimarinus]|nr:hypothetical protein [Nitratireductor aquimarinus]MBY5998868.1 hypothetical protein [Tritonibacter mobilis]MBY6020896.1 hypothetical protein [Nitratireductor sp. DP7N14-4]